MEAWRVDTLDKWRPLWNWNPDFIGQATTRDVENWCNTCASCATRKMPTPKPHAPLSPILVGSPMQLVAVDILGPLPTSRNGNQYILVASDYFTRWTEAYGIPNMEALTVAETLTQEIFFRFSPPESLHSDQGRQFESLLIKEVCRLLQIKKSRTSPYHPQGDGLVERFNRALLNMLAVSARNNPATWESHIRAVCFAYNTSTQPTTGYSPFSWCSRREAHLPVDLQFGAPSQEPLPSHENVRRLQSSLYQAYQQAQKFLGQAQQRQQEIYDRKVHGAPYEINDLVWLFSP